MSRGVIVKSSCLLVTNSVIYGCAIFYNINGNNIEIHATIQHA
jgi:hypothetical protein